ncbi:MAG TPA: phosphatase PAP2 family protein [Acidothermaceae bacterium]|nr:phosphatase PAP2 family protein [Acidothermaceae bacterium]
MKRTFALVLGGAALLLLTMITLGLLDVHLLAHSRFGRADGSVDSTLAHHRDHVLNALTLGATDAASTMPVVALAVIVMITAGLVFRRWREPLFVATAIVGEVAIFIITTFVVHRPRPNVVRLDHAPPTSSFPSGHTAAAVALCGSIAALVVFYGARTVWRRLAIAVAILFPIAVAASRLYRGMHYPTDVLGGALLGATWLRVSVAAVLGPPAAARTAEVADAPHERLHLAPQSNAAG